MRAWLRISSGLLLAVAGLLFGLLYVGVALLSDCPAACVARGERAVAWALAGAGFLVAIGGVVLVVRTWRARRRTRPPAS
ncbi:MAG: hypothetical protein QOE90_348 [Thermoplasmata archaeon]|jgi:membrane protein implicated in regulation of membrane protease activity|nr:hypothetical protein [Thermoplasmata archaeon]